MYQVSHFSETRLAVQHALIQAQPLGMLICNDERHRPMANSVPFLLDRDKGTLGTLQAHVARANPQWQQLQRAASCLVVFQGEDGYISPNWYPSKALHGKVVPTWNYITVHAWGTPQVIDDPDWLRYQFGEM